jgi:hypothetical protein
MPIDKYRIYRMQYDQNRKKYAKTISAERDGEEAEAYG